MTVTGLGQILHLVAGCYLLLTLSAHLEHILHLNMLPAISWS